MLPNPKRIIIFLIVLILLLLIFNLLVMKYDAFWQKISTSSLLKYRSMPKIYSPVNQDQIETIPSLDPKADNLVFFLTGSQPVYALFSGQVVRIVNSSGFDNVMLQGRDNWIVSYIIVGKILVKEGQEVTGGEQIATVDGNLKGQGCLAGGNLGINLFKDGQVQTIKPEMLEKN